MRSVQTCDAGVTVDQWATLVPVVRDGAVRRHMFEDCAHWWALAQYCLVALREIHALELVHLDIKADNICIPYAPALFDPDGAEDRLYPVFTRLALIDFAFSLVSRESLALPLPLGWQKDYDYQSPRLLKALDAGRDGDLEPTRELDWRCDFYSLAAMLKRYLPSDRRGVDDVETGWTSSGYDDARSLIFRLRDTHDRDLPRWRPHPELIDFCAARLDEPGLAGSMQKGWTLGPGEIAAGTATPITPMTPVTRIAIFRRDVSVTPLTHIASPEPIVRPELMGLRAARGDMAAIGSHVLSRPNVNAGRGTKLVLLSLVAGIAASAPSFIGKAEDPLSERASTASVERAAVPPVQPPSSSTDGAAVATPPGADPAKSAGDADDRAVRSQRDDGARIPNPAAGIGASGAPATDESRPVTAEPARRAGNGRRRCASAAIDAGRESFLVVRRDASRARCLECIANARGVRPAGQTPSDEFSVIGTVDCDGQAAWTRSFVGACERAPVRAFVSRGAIDIARSSRSGCDRETVHEGLRQRRCRILRLLANNNDGRKALVHCAPRRDACVCRRGGIDQRAHRFTCVRASGRGGIAGA